MNFIVYLLVIFKNIIYGSSVLFTSELLNTTDALDVVALRFLVSSAAFALLIAARVIKVDFKNKSFKYIILTSLFEPVLYFLFETVGISMTSNITAGILLAMSPIANAVAQALILKEKTGVMQGLCLLFGIGGVVYIVANTAASGGNDTPLGILLVLAAVISGAFYCAFSRKTTGANSFSPMEVTCFSAFFGAAVFNGANVARHIYCGTLGGYFLPFASFDNIIGFVFLGIISTICATGAQNFALSRLSPIRVSAFGGLSTVVTIALGVLCNGEELHLFHVIGTILILCCIFGVNCFSAKNPAKKEQ